MTPRSIPAVPLRLGLAGLIPFVGLAALHISGWGGQLAWSPGFVRTGLATYGAVILSFLGGVRWGLALLPANGRTARRDFVFSVIPSLAGWFALALPTPLDLLTLGLLILGLGHLDQDLPARGMAPAWFGTLRMILSAVAGTALLAAGLLRG
ncbi:MAG TPA: DUF3429 domain-containing protein [Beijerinckiaceae bacterium]|jgi:hypothetical protein